jgi:hypothetical protein
VDCFHAANPRQMSVSHFGGLHMLLLKDLGLVLVLACYLGVAMCETVRTVNHLLHTIEGVIATLRGPLPGRDHDAQASAPVKPEKADDPVRPEEKEVDDPVPPVRPEEKEAA